MLQPIFVQCAFYYCKITIILFLSSYDMNQGFLRFSACYFEMASFGAADKPSIPFGWSSVASTYMREMIRLSDRQVKAENVWSSIARKSLRNCLCDKFCRKLITSILAIRAVHNRHAMSIFQSFKLSQLLRKRYPEVEIIFSRNI